MPWFATPSFLTHWAWSRTGNKLPYVLNRESIFNLESVRLELFPKNPDQMVTKIKIHTPNVWVLKKDFPYPTKFAWYELQRITTCDTENVKDNKQVCVKSIESVWAWSKILYKVH